MPLTTGSRLGPYEVVSPLGSGGMGEVYRARDTQLNRDVALKVLPEAFSADVDRLARFKREAQVLASLSHPNIAAIFGFEDAGGVQALVLELVEGPTLADRVAQGPLPLDEALRAATQIAEALEAAHEQGVIHRDLKPANIKLRPDGTVKVLDFGLAKAIEGTGEPGGAVGLSQSPTITTPAMTGIGVILGTAAYMSPEQAKGRPVDKRSDVWAFGCVLFEMLSGRRAFEGEDVSDTLANVLKIDPDWNALPADIPSPVRTLIRRCLAKERRHRVADLSVARFVLDDPAGVAGSSPVSVVAAAPASAQRFPFRAIAAALVMAVLAAVGAWRLKPPAAAPPVTRFAFSLPSGQQWTPSSRHVMAISADGTVIAYLTNNGLATRSLGEFEGHVIPGTADAGISNPVFSPDGRSIAYYSARDDSIVRTALSGGSVMTVCATANPLGMWWDEKGIWFSAGSGGILRCAANGGTPEQLVTLADGESVNTPQPLLDGSALLFTIGKNADGQARWDKAAIVVQTLKSGARKTIVNGGTDARYLPSGHLIYASGGSLLGVRFDPARQEVSGGAVPVVEGVRRNATANSGAVQYVVSETGTLLYLPGPTMLATNQRSIAIADRAGAVTKLVVPAGQYDSVRASRDGGQLAVGVDDGREAYVSIQDISGAHAMRRLTFGGQNRFPIWSPDGQRVAFQSDREGDVGIFAQRADGTGPVERLTKAVQGEAHVPESWSPDGKHLSYSVARDQSFSLSILSVDDKKVAAFAGVSSREPPSSAFSPDGRWIAYTTTPSIESPSTRTRSANRGVYLQPFPPTGSTYQAPRQQLDFHPVWGPKGTELFFVPTAAGGQLTAVTVTTQPSLAFGSPVSLPARVTAGRLSGERRAFDILPDGRFVGTVAPSDSDSSASEASQMRVVLNWFEDLKQRLPAK